MEEMSLHKQRVIQNYLKSTVKHLPQDKEDAFVSKHFNRIVMDDKLYTKICYEITDKGVESTIKYDYFNKLAVNM